jgi:hypothetical protein
MSATQVKIERETMYKWKKAYEEEAQDHAATAINLQKFITELEQENTKLREQLKEANEVIGFYADPERNEKEWLEDYSYYDPYPPLRKTSNAHGKRARAYLLKHNQSKVEEHKENL